MKVKPLQDRILIKRLEQEAKTAGGIIIPDTAKEKPMEGLVMAVGTGKTLDGGETSKPQVAVGDKVLFGKYAGTEIKVDGEELIIIREEDILAIIE